jgi:hypothetical protein
VGEPSPAPAVVRDATREDVEGLEGLYRVLYGPDAEHQMAILDRTPPGGFVLRRVAVLDGELVGHVAEISVPTWIDRRRRTSGTRVHWVVSPRAQGMGVGTALTASRATVESFDLVLTMPNRRAAGSVSDDPRFTMVGALESWCRWRHPGAMTETRLGRLPRPVVAGALAVVAVLARAGARVGGTITDAPPTPAELDALAAASSSAARCLRIRDAAFIRWRMEANPDLRLTSVRDRRGRLRGWALHARARVDPAFGGVFDALTSGPGPLRAVLVHVADRLMAEGCDVVLFPHADPRRWARPTALAAGFVPRGPGRAVYVRATAPDLRGVCDQPGSWYLTLADGDHA